MVACESGASFEDTGSKWRTATTHETGERSIPPMSAEAARFQFGGVTEFLESRGLGWMDMWPERAIKPLSPTTTLGLGGTYAAQLSPMSVTPGSETIGPDSGEVECSVGMPRGSCWVFSPAEPLLAIAGTHRPLCDSCESVGGEK